jgi:hypothetical protein
MNDFADIKYSEKGLQNGGKLYIIIRRQRRNFLIG